MTGSGNAQTGSSGSDAEPRGAIECFDPATRKPLGEVRVDSPQDVARAVERARAAQPDWARASLAERRRVLQRLLDYVVANADAICDAVVADSGKTRENAMLGEVWPVCEKLRWTIRHGAKHLRPERVSSGLLLHKKAWIEFPPRGVIGVICPWNYPFQNIFGPTISALMAGNAVVVKASEWTAWSSRGFQRIFDELFAAAGFSPHLVQIVNGFAQTGRALAGAEVDLIVFTGSIENGREVLRAAAEKLTPVILELGGKDPLIVCDDADLEQSAHAALNGVFINAGQNCMAAERVLVLDGIYDAFERRVVELTRALRVGASREGERVDVGAIVSPLQLDKIEHMVDEAVAAGAVLLVGGKRVHGARGQYFGPTVLRNVDPDARILHEELFGPVMLLQRVRDDAEAVRIANASAFGLSSSVMSRDARRARRIAEQLVAGSTCINDFGLCYMAQDLPFGGVKHSGFGRLNARDGLRAFTNVKSVLADRLPLHRANRLFPVRESDYELARGAIRLIYGRGFAAKAAALVELARTRVRRAPRDA